MLLEEVILRGDRASQPAANTVPIGSIYYVTDEELLERSDGATWESYSGASGINELTGDVTAGPGTGSQAATIANDAVTYAKMQNVSATSRILGRVSGGAGNVEEATLTQILDFVGGPAQGDVLFRGASDWDNLAAGTTGYVLTTQGAAANPIWAPASPTNLQVAKLSVTDAQIRSLNTSPLTWVAAAGANMVVVPVTVLAKCVRSGTAFSADPSFRCRWTGITSDLVASWTALFNSAVAATLYRERNLLADLTLSTSDDPANKIVQLSSSADVTNGTGCSMVVSLFYYVADVS